MRITFFGAAENVTGSKHLIETENYKLLLDCGLFQGKRDHCNIANRSLPFDPKTIDAVILSHAHIDHCGMLPVLIKQGYKGKIFATTATADIAQYMLKDAAAIQEQDSIYCNDHLKVGENPVYPVYTAEDVEATITHLEPIPYFRNNKEWTQLNDNIRFKFLDAGHILGSAVTIIEIKEGTKTKTVAFTGDLGKPNVPLLFSPEPIDQEIDVLISECTYGNGDHPPLQESIDSLIEIVNKGFNNSSKILIPSFSLGRTQEILYVLHKLTKQRVIPSLPIYLDSPLAENLSEVFHRHEGDYNSNVKKDFGDANETPFEFANLIYIGNAQESKALNDKMGPFIIISASGMMEGGRILHHLRHNISNPNNIIAITGYQAENTLGRKIQDGVSPVKIFGDMYDVRAEVVKLHAFSAHADQSSLNEYIQGIPKLHKVFLVHSESPQATAFQQILHKYNPKLEVTIPSAGKSFDI